MKYWSYCYNPEIEEVDLAYLAKLASEEEERYGVTIDLSSPSEVLVSYNGERVLTYECKDQ